MDGEIDAADRMISRREFTAALSAAVTSVACAASGAVMLGGAHKRANRDRYACCVQRGLDYLALNKQIRGGTFAERAGLGAVALINTAILRQAFVCNPEFANPRFAESLKDVGKSIHPHGGTSSPNGTFTTHADACLAILCLMLANTDHRYDDVLDRAETYIRAQQWNESRRIEADDLIYGGAGYGKHRRPDLFNTALFIDALKARGRTTDDAAIQKALIFVSRCQNVESAHNTTPFSVLNPDGGFYDTCAAGGDSKAGATPHGGLRSYGSTTCNGLRSMLHAGLPPDDPRVRIATTWIGKDFDLQANRGLGDGGLFYYYHTLAETFDAMDVNTLENSARVTHLWREELAEELCRRQRRDGSWINTNGRWMESEPVLATARALLALSYCRPPMERFS